VNVHRCRVELNVRPPDDEAGRIPYRWPGQLGIFAGAGRISCRPGIHWYDADAIEGLGGELGMPGCIIG
jgi:hypothetical protein